MKNNSKSRILLVLAPWVLLLAGCGSSSVLDGKTDAEIYQLTQDAAKNQKTVILQILAKENPETTHSEISYGNDGKAQGTFTAQGRTTKIVTDGTKIYIKQDNATGAAKDKFVEYAVTAPEVTLYATLLNKEKLLTELLAEEKTVTKVDGIEIDGKSTIGLKGKNGILYVAQASEPLPLKIVNDEKGEMIFSKWGEDMPIEIPAADEVVAGAKTPAMN